MYLHRRRVTLLGGDTAALLLFAAIGRRNHGEGLQIVETCNTALPFLVGKCCKLFSQLYIGLSLICGFEPLPRDMVEGIPSLAQAGQQQLD